MHFFFVFLYFFWLSQPKERRWGFKRKSRVLSQKLCLLFVVCCFRRLKVFAGPFHFLFVAFFLFLFSPLLLENLSDRNLVKQNKKKNALSWS